MIIAIDFDGTIVEHRFPELGNMMPYAIDAIKALKDSGHKLILWTCRNDHDPANNGRKLLTEAVDLLKANGIEFDAVNANIEGLAINPTPKVYADVYIDDRNLGANVNWWHIMYESGLTYLKPYERVIIEYFVSQGYDLYANTKKRIVTEPRQICMAILSWKTPLSLAKIGEMIGNKDHATVLHAKKTVGNLMRDRDYMAKYQHIFNHFNIN